MAIDELPVTRFCSVVGWLGSGGGYFWTSPNANRAELCDLGERLCLGVESRKEEEASSGFDPNSRRRVVESTFVAVPLYVPSAYCTRTAGTK